MELLDSKLESWMKSVRYLRLPRPTRSDFRQFRLDGWPELMEVQCMDVDDLIDGNPVSLSISNAPKLKTLSLLEHQAFDLNLDDLPSFTDLLMRRKGFWRNQNTAQGNLWIHNLSFRNLGSLRKATFNVGAFESIRIQGCPLLECEVHSIARLSEEATQEFIKSVGNSDGITSLDLTGLPIDKLDLVPITYCKTIKRLEIPICAMIGPQVQSLSSLNAIEELKIQSAFSESELSVAELLENRPKIKLEELKVEDALRVWPKLKRIEGDAMLSDSIQLESFLDFESCMDGDWRAATVVHLLDLPQLSDRIQVSQSLQSLHIQRTPELRGLSTFAPWPEDASIEGLSKLETFSAGGLRFQDKEFTAIEDSTSLEALTLAYCGMTPERLRDIGKFTKLKALGLTGTNVTDTTLRSWTELTDLSILMLDRTQITVASVPWICKLRLLEHLSINANCFAAVIQEPAAFQNTLRSLSLFGDGLAIGTLSTLSTFQQIGVLRLEDALLTREMMVELANCIPKTIQVIDLCNCTIDPKDLVEFIDSIRSDIWLGVDGIEVPAELQVSLLQKLRVATEDFSDFFRPDVSNYLQTSVWPRRSEFNTTIMDAATSSTWTQSPVFGRIRWPSTFVKPSLFAPSS